MRDEWKLPDGAWDRLPRPILPRRPELVETYRAAWAIAITRGLRPALAWNPTGKPFIDANFSDNIYQWDSCFIAMFLKYARGAFDELPDVMSCIDNFYAGQHDDGAIPREIDPKGRATSNKNVSEDTAETNVWWRAGAFTNPPLFSWMEWEYYRHTGDDSRLARVLPKLARYFDWYAANRTRKPGYFWWDRFGCGMDNVPRGDAHGWVDYTAQAALDSELLSLIALYVGDDEIAQSCAANYLGLQELVNDKMWNEMTNTYSDVDEDDLWTGTLNVGNYWPLMAGIAPPDRALTMMRHLRNYRFFGRKHLVPRLSAHERGYDPLGGYWLGGVWAPTTYMTMRAMERNGFPEVAHEIALSHCTNVAEVFMKTGTIWENYAPDHAEHGNKAKPDFCGWSALGPIAMLIEGVLGLRVNGADEELAWRPLLDETHGIENLRVKDAYVSLYAERVGAAWRVTLSSTAPVEVRLHGFAGVVSVALEAGVEEKFVVR
ncbi:trehalase family glycosidase [soil metagenome]